LENYIRLKSPFKSNIAAWNFISVNENNIVAFYFEILSEAAPSIKILKLKGLDKKAIYKNLNTCEIFGGDELMYSGVSILLKKQDFRNECYHFQKI